MRILHVISALAAGGAEALVRDLSLNLSERGHHLAVAFISNAKDQGNDAGFEDDFIRRLAARAIRTFEIGFSARRNVILGAWRLRAIIQEFKPDVLHIHLATALAFRLSVFVSVPTVYTHHNVRFQFPRQLLRLFDAVVDHYVAISETNRQLLIGLTRKPVTRIYNGISGKKFELSRRPESDTHFEILSVGRVHEQKDYDTLIEVAAVVASDILKQGRTIRFRVAGDGAGVTDMRRKVRERGLVGVVEFLGARTDVPDLMAESDAMLMTSIYEGLPISLIEAQHSGLPVVTTDVGGCGEIVQAGFNGALAKARDPCDIANKLLEILNSSETLARFSQNARSAARRFSVETCAESHFELYRHVVRKSLGRTAA